MKKKIVIALIIVVVVLVALFVVIKFMPTGAENKLSENQNSEESGQSGQMVTDDFSIGLPEGWSKVSNAVSGVDGMAMNANEVIADAKANEMGFKSYVAVTSDTLSGQSLQEYMQAIKDELENSIPDVVFDNESSLNINNREGRSIEVDLTQGEVNFKFLWLLCREPKKKFWRMDITSCKHAWLDKQTHFP
jgi:hypothetical protein